MKIVPPVFPYRGLRGVDSWGAGGFMSPRDRGARRHYGLDFLGLPGDTIVASIGGVVESLGFMYANSPAMRNIHLRGMEEYEHYLALAGYVQAAPGIHTGVIVQAGDVIGTLQDVAAFWGDREPQHVGTMKNHCHFGLKIDGMWIDPARYLPKDLPTC